MDRPVVVVAQDRHRLLQAVRRDEVLPRGVASPRVRRERVEVRPGAQRLGRDLPVERERRLLGREPEVARRVEQPDVVGVADVDDPVRDEGQDEALPVETRPARGQAPIREQLRQAAHVGEALRAARLLQHVRHDDGHHAHERDDDPHHDEDLDEREAGLATNHGDSPGRCRGRTVGKSVRSRSSRHNRRADRALGAVPPRTGRSARLAPRPGAGTERASENDVSDPRRRWRNGSSQRPGRFGRRMPRYGFRGGARDGAAPDFDLPAVRGRSGGGRLPDPTPRGAGRHDRPRRAAGDRRAQRAPCHRPLRVPAG